MKVLFTFENPLPSREADAEVFTATARALARVLAVGGLHRPAAPPGAAPGAGGATAGLREVTAWAPRGPGMLRHLFCGLTVVLRRAFREADLGYTRNLWVAAMAILFGQRVVFDHYRPWGDQIPPLQHWLHRLHCRRGFLLNICHSEYTRAKYLALGIPPARLACVRNGHEPARLAAPLPPDEARRAIGTETGGIELGRATVAYVGRLNNRKGLALALEAARLLPDVLFLLVGSTGEGPIERAAAAIPNVRIVGWQPSEQLALYLSAADILLVPPSTQPLARFDSTVLPLKLFLYMASGRPIVAGATPDVQELLVHGRNALLCRPDDASALAEAIAALARDPALRARLAAAARAEGELCTWDARADRIARLIGARLAVPSVGRGGGWHAAQRLAWRRGSWRWLVHLLRARSWVLPPARIALATGTGPGQDTGTGSG